MDAIAKLIPALTVGTTGAGLIGNIMNSIQRGKVASQAEKNANLTPEQLGSMVSKAEQPLSNALIQQVTGAVNATDAAKGLSGAPGILSADIAGTLAPYEQQNQQTALQLILKQLGLPDETLAALSAGGGGNANMSPLLMMLMQMMQKKPATTTPPPQTAGTPGITPGGDWGGGGLDTTGLGV
jgi:hypothetical protein